MADLTKYERYKPSGVVWIGEIPELWIVKHLKRYLNFYNNIRIPLSSEERADLENIYDYYGASGVIDKVDRYLFDGNYILIGEDGANLLDRNSPLAFKASGKFWVNNHAHILKPINGSIDYYIYFLENIDFTVFITGSAQPKLTIEALSSVRIIVPPLDEQLSIAKYLDTETQKLDHLIANKKAQAAKLKELRQIEINNAVTKGLNPDVEIKDSGIDWLGKIPKHWEVRRLKNILININSGDGIKNDDLIEEGEFEIYGGNGVMGYTDKFNSEGKVIVIGRVGAKCGIVYLVDKRIWISDNALKSRTYNSYEFVYYLIDAMNLNNYANQNAQPLITGGILKALFAAIPPKNEQIQIANYLQGRITVIDKLIQNIEDQIDKLQELRKIKIYEAVTGKIKVKAYAETATP